MSYAAIVVGAVSVGTAIYQGYEANKQKKKAEELAKNTQRPTYQIPSAVEQYMSDAQKKAAQGMSEQSRQRYIDQIARNSAYAVAGNVGRQEGLQGVSAANMAMNEANANLMVMDEQQRQRNQEALQAARLNYAGYEDKAFAYNKDMPYQDNAAAIRALQQGAAQSEAAAVSTLATGITSAGTIAAANAGEKTKDVKKTPPPTTPPPAGTTIPYNYVPPTTTPVNNYYPNSSYNPYAPQYG